MTARLLSDLASGFGSEPVDRRKRNAQATIASLKMRGLALLLLAGIAASAGVWAYYFQQERAAMEADTDA
jgi:hypothetical protein